MQSSFSVGSPAGIQTASNARIPAVVSTNTTSSGEGRASSPILPILLTGLHLLILLDGLLRIR